MATGTYIKNIQWVIQESLTISMIYTFSLINVTCKRYFCVSICRFITDFYLSAYNKCLLIYKAWTERMGNDILAYIFNIQIQ